MFFKVILRQNRAKEKEMIDFYAEIVEAILRIDWNLKRGIYGNKKLSI
jgi:hypothetical protein